MAVCWLNRVKSLRKSKNRDVSKAGYLNVTLMCLSCIIHVQPVGSGTRRILFSAFYVKYFKVGLVWNMFERVQEKACA